MFYNIVLTQWRFNIPTQDHRRRFQVYLRQISFTTVVKFLAVVIDAKLICLFVNVLCIKYNLCPFNCRKFSLLFSKISILVLSKMSFYYSALIISLQDITIKISACYLCNSAPDGLRLQSQFWNPYT